MMSHKYSPHQIYPYFYQVLVDLVEYFGWSYITLIATRGDYGEDGAEETRRLAEDKGICASQTILLDASDNAIITYDSVITALLDNPDAKGKLYHLRQKRHFKTNVEFCPKGIQTYP